MKTLTKFILVVSLLWALLCGLWTVSYAAIPHLINYQGRLTDSSGTPLNGSYSLTFRIYDAETSGTLLWEETHSGVVIQKGIFSLLLGSVTNLNLAFDKPYFLEIKVGNEVMSPRQRIASAGYAYMAENVLSIPRGVIVMWSGRILDIPSGWALCDGTNGTPDLRDKFITGARQDDGGIAKTNVSGSLTQTGGEAAHVLTVAEMPVHNHNVYLDSSYNEGSWHHDPNSVHRGSPNSPSWTGAPVANAGGGNAHNNLPPYYALAYIMKL